MKHLILAILVIGVFLISGCTSLSTITTVETTTREPMYVASTTPTFTPTPSSSIEPIRPPEPNITPPTISIPSVTPATESTSTPPPKFDTQMMPIKTMVNFPNVTINPKFTLNGYNQLSWTEGLLMFNDGRIQHILPGSFILTTTHYFYWVLDNSTLQNSTSESDAIGNDRRLIAIYTKLPTPSKDSIIDDLPAAIQGWGR